jgi:hypothetical protein
LHVRIKRTLEGQKRKLLKIVQKKETKKETKKENKHEQYLNLKCEINVMDNSCAFGKYLRQCNASKSSIF